MSNTINWMPVSKKPEFDDEYLVTVETDFETRYVTSSCYHAGIDEWDHEAVVTWAYMPEPYEEDSYWEALTDTDARCYNCKSVFKFENYPQWYEVVRMGPFHKNIFYYCPCCGKKMTKVIRESQS